MHSMRIRFNSKPFSNFFRGSRGFTLSELAVALVVTGVLAGIALPNFLGNRNNSFDKDAQASIDVVLQAAKIHYQTYGDFSDGISTLKFAQRVALIKNNAILNEAVDPA